MTPWAQSAQVSRPPLPWWLRGPGIGLAVVLVVAWRGVEGDLGALFAGDARTTMADFASGFLPPKLDGAFLQGALWPTFETLAIAVLGVGLATLLAAPLSLLAMRPGVSELPTRRQRLRWVVYGATRSVLNVMRSIPELIWALLFVRALGIGPGPGVLAIGVAYAGMMGKVFAELFESTSPAAARALVAAGASPSRAFLFGTLPQALPLTLSYWLYRFECALRASAILGLVGAGGIGLQLELSIKMFAWDEVASWVLVLLVLVGLTDLVSGVVRRRLRQAVDFFPKDRRGVLGRTAVTLGGVAAVIGSARALEASGWELFTLEALRGMATFASGLYPPSLSPQLLEGLFPAVLETLFISIIGGAVATVLGLLLALVAAKRRSLVEAQGAGALLSPLRLAARGVLAMWRTLPELVWALLFIFAVGLGPFAGALALGLHNAGVLGRLFTETLEEVSPAPGRALRLLGGRSLGTTVFATLPQAAPQLLGYALYRWEVGIRASAVLGVVGAGGLGTQMHVALSLFQYGRAATLVLTILALVTAVDLFSGWLRARLSAREGGRDSKAGAGASWELAVAGQRLYVVALGRGGARVFTPTTGASLPDSAPATLLGSDLGGIRCEVRTQRRDRFALGEIADVALVPSGFWDRWRLWRAARLDLARRPHDVRKRVRAW